MRFCYYCQRLIPNGDEIEIAVGVDRRFGHKDCMERMFGRKTEEVLMPYVATHFDEFTEMCKELEIDNKLEA